MRGSPYCLIETHGKVYRGLKFPSPTRTNRILSWIQDPIQFVWDETAFVETATECGAREEKEPKTLPEVLSWI